MTEKGERLIGTSRAIRLLESELEYAARSDAKVLITGESGVGKEVVAHLMHRLSHRSRGPMVAINCAGLPDSLLESELFGHVRGSFTGAFRDRPGLLEMAHCGTAFLDEVGEMTLRMQALLLRFLETGEIQRVGSDRLETRVDVRVIAATNRNLMDRIAAREFREDLFYRLNVIHLAIPPLRERREDIPAFLRHYLQVFADRHRVPTPEFSADAFAQLVGYDWPGNVRELKNVLERLVLRARTGLIFPPDLPKEISGSPPIAPPTASRASEVDALFGRMAADGESFWSVVYPAFMLRDLTRADLRSIVARGLEQAHGSYKLLVQLFNMRSEDYKKFLNFLRKHDCHMPFQQFRSPRAADDTSRAGAGGAGRNPVSGDAGESDLPETVGGWRRSRS
jgi:two-component system, NtrC family, response regulator AtoC